MLAKFYENGDGIEKNLEKAFYWYQKAAENGCGLAMLMLAKFYENGDDIEKNLERPSIGIKKQLKMMSN